MCDTEWQQSLSFNSRHPPGAPLKVVNSLPTTNSIQLPRSTTKVIPLIGSRADLDIRNKIRSLQFPGENLQRIRKPGQSSFDNKPTRCLSSSKLTVQVRVQVRAQVRARKARLQHLPLQRGSMGSLLRQNFRACVLRTGLKWMIFARTGQCLICFCWHCKHYNSIHRTLLPQLTQCPAN